jgi:FtsH-binding integral membrane protein
MFVGLIAIVIASLINIFIGSTVLQMVISAIGYCDCVHGLDCI